MSQRRSIVVAALGVMCAALATPDEAAAQADSVVGVFEGRTPCHALALDFTLFPTQGCEKIKWRLTLYQDPATGRPTTYWYDGTKSERRGRWSVEPARGGGDRQRIYYLQYGDRGARLSLLSLDDRVLLLLDRELEMLVGDPSWSFVLNRMPPLPSRQR